MQSFCLVPCQTQGAANKQFLITIVDLIHSLSWGEGRANINF